MDLIRNPFIGGEASGTFHRRRCEKEPASVVKEEMHAEGHKFPLIEFIQFKLTPTHDDWVDCGGGIK